MTKAKLKRIHNISFHLYESEKARQINNFRSQDNIYFGKEVRTNDRDKYMRLAICVLLMFCSVQKWVVVL